ncbi:MAG: pilin [Patescibacteria group bacterium]|jgi:uncharacterized membrane protein|nr:pilin [Patescibacteria group bacterium]
MKKILKPLFGILILIALLILPFFVFAQDDTPVDDTASEFTEEASPSTPLSKLNEIGDKSVFTTDNTLPSVVGMIVNAALSLLGIIFVILIIVGGFKWMTAGGNEESVKTATNYIKRAIIGLIITLSSYAIWEFILKRLL